MRFDDFWPLAIAILKDKIAKNDQGREENFFISSWRPDKGFSDEKFPVRGATLERITCLTIHAGKPIEIPISDMATLYDLWDDYINGAVSRIEVVEKVPRTAYAISLMKFLKESIP